MIVEGNTDVLALRQAGFEPVVASMGTALTENQLRELSRLTSRLYLCFDSDAAGQDATLRGMELATKRGFEVYVVPLPPGNDPADDPHAFQERLASPSPYALHRVELELTRMEDRQHAYLRIQEFLNGLPESPERQEAWRLANDRLGLTVQLRAGVTLDGGQHGPRLGQAARGRDALGAGRTRRMRGTSRAGRDPGRARARALRRSLAPAAARPPRPARRGRPELLRLLAELDARAEAEGIDVETGKQLLLRLRERRLERELDEADLEDVKELQAALARVRDAVREFA